MLLNNVIPLQQDMKIMDSYRLFFLLVGREKRDNNIKMLSYAGSARKDLLLLL